MKQLAEWFFKLLEALMVLLLALMSIMVFANVVMRYGFNSGLNEAEELARFMFIWLTFIGAIVAMRDGGHLGVDMVVRRLSPGWRKAAVTLSYLLMLGCCVVFFWGLAMQHDVNMANTGMVTGISLGLVYGVAYLSTLSMAAILVLRLAALYAGRMTVDDLIAVGESE